MEEWYIYSKKADFAAISQKFNISPMLARILRNRDIISDEEISGFLYAGIDDMYDPYLLKGMSEGIRITSDVIDREEKIRIIGDYDVDGVCSSYILSSFIRKAGGIVDVRLPDRMTEGYGMNESMADEASEDGISLIITCDNGISSNEAIQKARTKGIRVIVTDHHEPPEILPSADVIIDPKQKGCTYPFKEICGGGVAYKFITALSQYRNIKDDSLMDELLQFAGMATIADIVPLIDENRIFAKEGLKRLKTTQNIGLCTLLEARHMSRNSINAVSVGFVIGPCINSAGRLKNAGMALDLFEAEDQPTARRIAYELSDLNEERKRLTLSQTETALKMISEKNNSGKLDKVLVVYLPDAHESVAGIVAGRIKEEYSRPAIVITGSDEGLKGSGRSVPAYNMIEGLREQKDLFLKAGGHAMACGFTLKQKGTDEETVRNFTEKINALCSCSEDDLIKKIWIDMELPFKYATVDFAEELHLAEPFGTRNEKPLFAGRNIKVTDPCIFGKSSNVLKLKLEDPEGYIAEGIMFGNEISIAREYAALKEHSRASVLFYPEINEFRGLKRVQLVIRAIRIFD